MEKKIILTEKENKMVKYLLENTDGSDVHIFSFIDLEKAGFELNEAKGVFGSIVDKGILHYDAERSEERKIDSGDPDEMYQWAVHVSDEQQYSYTQKYVEIKTVDQLLEKIRREND